MITENLSLNYIQGTLELPNQTDKKVIPFFTRIIATGFYSGYSPIAPGTAGSLVALAIYWILNLTNPIIFSILIITTFFIGIISSNKMELILGEDPPVVVIDEIVGMWISLIFIQKSLFIVITAFFIFRIYDIIKPQPARFVEKFKNGWGIMLDDVVSGIYSNITLQFIIIIIHNLLPL